MLLALLLLAAPIVAEPAPPTIWIGPKTFTSGRSVRPDFFPVLCDANAWPTVLGRTQVFKSYIMLLPDIAVPGNAAPESSDEQLTKLAELLKSRGLKVAFEVGGLRQGPELPGEHWGRDFAESELRWLRRWKKCGGALDYLTTDHAIMMNIGSCHVQPDQHRDCGLTLAQTLEQLMDYFVAVRAEFPDTKLGCIESLGFFHVNGPDGHEYQRTVKALPVWHFEDYVDLLLAAMARRGLTLDHFHIDYGYEGVHNDGRRAGTEFDYGRLLAIERYVQSKGVRAGVIVNAFHDRKVANPDPETADREACEHTKQFLGGYLASGGQAEDLILQTWQPYPDHTGPETDPLSVLGLHRELLGLLPQ